MLINNKNLVKKPCANLYSSFVEYQSQTNKYIYIYTNIHLFIRDNNNFIYKCCTYFIK